MAHLDVLLNILRKRLLPQLPKCSKTFLDSSKADYTIKAMRGANNHIGDFVYLGIKEGIINCLNPDVHKNNIIILQMNVDGASPYKSSTKQLWPILCKIFHEVDIYSPFPVAIYYGDSKPGDINEFMDDFIQEINFLHKNGIYIDNIKYTVILKHIICDIPARKFLKQIKGHGGYAACERCQVYGKNAGFPNKRIIYPDVDCCKRSDDLFRKQHQEEHHTGYSPLLRIQQPIDMIYSFPLDYMHMCCLGITKKFYVMDLLFNKTAVKLKFNLQQKLSERMLHLKSYIPDEFQRKSSIELLFQT